MLPVVMGIKNASLQILLYSLLLMFISLLAVTVSSSLGWIYVSTSIFLGTILLIKSYKLFRNLDRPSAVSTYKFSLLYLFVLIGAVMVDSSITFLEL